MCNKKFAFAISEQINARNLLKSEKKKTLRSLELMDI